MGLIDKKSHLTSSLLFSKSQMGVTHLLYDDAAAEPHHIILTATKKDLSFWSW